MERRIIHCKMCGDDREHMTLGEDMNPSVRWKCMTCGEYNQVKRYKVTVKEVHSQVVWVQAGSKENAILKVKDGEGEYAFPMSFEYQLDSPECPMVAEEDE